MKSKNAIAPFVSLRNIVETIPGYLYWCDLQGFVIGCNQLQANIFGFETENGLIGKKIHSFYPKSEAKLIKKATEIAIEQHPTPLRGHTKTSNSNYFILL